MWEIRAHFFWSFMVFPHYFICFNNWIILQMINCKRRFRINSHVKVYSYPNTSRFDFHETSSSTKGSTLINYSLTIHRPPSYPHKRFSSFSFLFRLHSLKIAQTTVGRTENCCFADEKVEKKAWKLLFIHFSTNFITLSRELDDDFQKWRQLRLITEKIGKKSGCHPQREPFFLWGRKTFFTIPIQKFIAFIKLESSSESLLTNFYLSSSSFFLSSDLLQFCNKHLALYAEEYFINFFTTGR